MTFPATARVKDLNSYHPEYEDRIGAYEDFGVLYEGGKAIKDKVTQFLRKRPKELSDVYLVRQLNFSYTNLLGNIIGWYSSAIFKTAPQIVKKPADPPDPLKAADGKAPAPPKLPAEVEDFCESFEKDCDGAGTTFVDFWPQVLESLLLYLSGYVLLDLPVPDADEPATLAQQKGAGLLNPYLVFYDPRQVINWETDAQGNLEWAIVRVRVREQEFLQDSRLVDYWYYFDRTQCALYERDVKPNENQIPSTEVATLVEGYPRPHALSDIGRVPLRKVSVPKGLWLANRVYLPLLNHLNLDNSLDFGLFQSNLAQLVIEDGASGRYEDGNPPGGAPVSSEVGYHHLPNGGKMYYLEPAGKSYEASQKRIDNLEERVYKACYLQDQARTNKSTPTAQSGVSKSMDKTPSRDAMCALGDVVRAAMQSVYQDAMDLRGLSDYRVDIRGLDFSDKATAEDMDLLEKSTVVPVASTTFEREVAKKLVRLSLPDANGDVLAVIDNEIDTNPTPAEQQAQQEEQQRADMLTKFSSSFKGADQIGA
jgi:hypothetical protein